MEVLSTVYGQWKLSRNFKGKNSVAFDLATIKLGLAFLVLQMIIFALNDNPDPTMVESGCHWSLVVYSRLAS